MHHYDKPKSEIIFLADRRECKRGIDKFIERNEWRMQCQTRWIDWIGDKTRGCCHYFQSIQRDCLDSNMLAFKQGYIRKKFKNTEQFKINLYRLKNNTLI